LDIERRLRKQLSRRRITGVGAELKKQGNLPTFCSTTAMEFA
jgi:hypothetical protein